MPVTTKAELLQLFEDASAGQLSLDNQFLNSAIDPKKYLDLTKERPSSHFCLHNPQINAFALSGPDEMAATILFAVASQLKDWGTIYTLYPYLIQYLKDGHRVDRYDQKEVGKLGVLLFPHNKNIQAMWDMRHSIYTEVKKHYHNDLDLYKYLRTLPGLGIIKAGFAIQLIAGKFGCIDNVNSYFYGAQAPNTRTNTDKKQAEYVQFLHQLELTLNDPISKRLWDDWCDIVAHRIRNSGGNKKTDLLVNMRQGKVTIPSYGLSHITRDYYQQGGQKTGHDVSFEHGEAITGAFQDSDEFKHSRLEEEKAALAPLLEMIQHSLALLSEV